MTQSPAIPLPPPKERRRLREAGSLTQAQVAARVGVTRETVRAWESGRTTPRGRKRKAYARLLDKLAESKEREPELKLEPKPKPKPKLELELEPSSEPKPEPEPKPDPDPEPTPTPTPTPEPEPKPDSESAEPAPDPSPLTPAQAFDALYAFCAPALVRQTYLLTGRRELARESVERAFQLAWQRWPEVARDRDPAGWMRAAAYEYALSPWHRFRPRYRHPEPPPADAADRALLDVLLKLPPHHRRTLVLYDGVGLDLPDTAAETEATTPAAAHRLLHAREAVAARLPDLADPTELHHRLAEVASGERLRAAKPTTVRTDSERRARFWTRAAIAFTIALIGTTVLTVHTAATHYEPPVAPGAAVQGVPPKVAPGPLSGAEIALRAKLRGETASGPDRLVPTTE
ncbi:helix-turn-helix domain-containing protein [Streptomyces dysideae]|uniref:RNA polymerase subunit sigma-24 n=1 Tax=Streptomyces dysideae TaxID=909626 RepID=A0A101V326_9ACTN|nr:helix-turn-helix domain-containing protein [Streptomyces dysideae]KUO21582.1 RNA polymerase subunit sigma-24 [Streptomyces dysideae]